MRSLVPNSFKTVADRENKISILTQLMTQLTEHQKNMFLLAYGMVNDMSVGAMNSAITSASNAVKGNNANKTRLS